MFLIFFTELNRLRRDFKSILAQRRKGTKKSIFYHETHETHEKRQIVFTIKNMNVDATVCLSIDMDTILF